MSMQRTVQDSPKKGQALSNAGYRGAQCMKTQSAEDIYAVIKMKLDWLAVPGDGVAETAIKDTVRNASQLTTPSGWALVWHLSKRDSESLHKP